MGIRSGNLLDDIPSGSCDEVFTQLLAVPGLRLERIVSTGQASPPGFWYDQASAEWVLLVAGSAELRIEGEAAPHRLKPGDYLHLPPHCRHRVEATDPDGPTVWLALHLMPHVLPDLLPAGLRVVFCGTAAGAVSAARGAYYAGPGNRFWPILAETGLTPRRLSPDEFRLLPEYGIGLTDIAKHHSGSDASLPADGFDPDGLRQRIRAVSPAVLAFNGKKAAAAFYGRPTSGLSYGEQPAEPDFPRVVILPSTSRAANGAWSPDPWFALAGMLGVGPDDRTT